MKFNQKCDEHLVFKPFLMTMIQKILLSELIWHLLATGTPCGTHGSSPKQ